MTRQEGAGLRVYTPKPLTMEMILARSIEEGECLLWQGAIDSYGYPRYYIDGKNQLLRPYMWRQIQGKELRPGYRLSVRCGNKRCLSEKCIVTRSYKVVAELHGKRMRQDPVMVQRFRDGAKNSGNSKLTPEIVAEIRASQQSDADVATQYGINRSTAGRIRRGDIWAAPKVANSVWQLADTMGVA